MRGDLEKGKNLYKLKCSTCHGSEAEGLSQFKTGSLAILEDWYLLGQLRNYKNGKRAYHNDDLSGKLMASQLNDLNDIDFKNLVKFISSKAP